VGTTLPRYRSLPAIRRGGVIASPPHVHYAYLSVFGTEEEEGSYYCNIPLLQPTGYRHPARILYLHTYVYTL
jgi:hypothetical protein